MRSRARRRIRSVSPSGTRSRSRSSCSPRSTGPAPAPSRFTALSRPAGRDHTQREHAQLAETAKGYLTEHLAERVTLNDVARAAHSSEFHLARIFREQTGFTLHGYRTHLRLRLALDRLADDELDLTALAAELGFSSHSHLTRAFKTIFGAPPSLIRSAFRLRELRRIVEAPLLVPT